MKNRLRETWNSGKPALNGWLGIPSTFSAEIMSKQDFDSITIDLQHGLTDYSIAVPMMQAMSIRMAVQLQLVTRLACRGLGLFSPQPMNCAAAVGVMRFAQCALVLGRVYQ